MDDLAEIWVFIALEAAESRATSFVGKLHADFQRLRRAPLMGTTREVVAPGLRVFFHGRYAIYYQPHENELVIVRVLHGARDIAAIVEEGGFSE